MPDIPQSEVVDAHRRCRSALPTGTAEPYDVRLVAVGFESDPHFPRRWAPARCATPTQLRDYWSKQSGPDAAAEPAFHAASSQRRDLNATSCSTHKESTIGRSRCSRSAGWLVACTPAGFVVHLKEFYGAESLGQRYFFLGEVFEAAPCVTTIVHDDACHLRRYVASRAQQSNLAQTMAYPRVRYVVDRFHARNHTDARCAGNCLATCAENVACMEGVNSSACEQYFSKLGRHKYVISKMGEATGAFFLNEVIELRNRAHFNIT
jgi:hypothetical protein